MAWPVWEKLEQNWGTGNSFRMPAHAFMSVGAQEGTGEVRILPGNNLISGGYRASVKVGG